MYSQNTGNIFISTSAFVLPSCFFAIPSLSTLTDLAGGAVLKQKAWPQPDLLANHQKKWDKKHSPLVLLMSATG